MTRRTALLLTPWLAAAKSDEAGAAAESARAEITRRFLDPLGTIYHYTGLAGEVVRPGAEDCAANKPSAMSWSTPIEDGAFFGGLYLDGLVSRWKALKTTAAARDAHRIAEGLVRLGRHSQVPGFIARGICADGRTHYSASSEDQTFPWFYGLWRYAKSGLPDAAARASITSLLEKHALAIESHGWRIPCAPPEFGYRGTYLRATGYDSSRLLFLHRLMHDLTGARRWLEGYERFAVEHPARSGKSRLDLCGAGIEFGNLAAAETKFWTTSMGVAALRGLQDLESDPKRRERYSQGLRESAGRAAPHILRYRKFDPSSRMQFDVDWRFLNKAWKPQANCDEAIALARSLLPLWAEKNPRSIYEDQAMREPLFAAWIVALTGDRELVRAHRQEIRTALRHYRWRELFTSTFFVAVNVYYEGARWGL